MLARPLRLTQGSDYRLVVRRGKRSGGAFVVTSVMASGSVRAPRFGFIVSKQVGTAVVRNTVRRRLKAICFDISDTVPAGTDVVIRALPRAAEASFAELRHEVNRGITRGLS
ncbi:ribonuclease P protein component [Microbacterium sp. YY-01]|uniref:ribonuclease P protein component n=1 Tax=Microbacterium sp. YY-01 TaxID=3421634 RepID=UPI003D180342